MLRYRNQSWIKPPLVTQLWAIPRAVVQTPHHSIPGRYLQQRAEPACQPVLYPLPHPFHMDLTICWHYTDVSAASHLPHSCWKCRTYQAEPHLPFPSVSCSKDHPISGGNKVVFCRQTSLVARAARMRGSDRPHCSILNPSKCFSTFGNLSLNGLQ